jgi:hypothetical protein
MPITAAITAIRNNLALAAKSPLELSVCTLIPRVAITGYIAIAKLYRNTIYCRVVLSLRAFSGALARAPGSQARGGKETGLAPCKLHGFSTHGGMVESSRRTGLSGPALVRLLARLTDLDVPEPGQSLADRLSLWLGWTDAIALSTVLNSHPSPVPSAPADAQAQECARLRATLTKAISEHRAARRERDAKGRAQANATPPRAPVDYVIYRQRYTFMQHSMETGIGDLRNRLRAALAGKTPAMAQLAAVDAVMERALGGRERSLLAAVPGLLEGHFNRLRQAEEAALADADNGGAAVKARPGAWLDVFRKDMRSVLLAELDIRFQPVEGLLAALRAS